MSKRWIVILLFVSLAFNLAVLTMFLHITAFRRPLFCLPGMRPLTELRERNEWKNQKRFPRPEDRLDNKDEIKALKKDFWRKRRIFKDLLRQDTFNAEEAVKAMEASLAAQDVLEKKVGTSLIEFRKKLTPEQAKEFFKERRSGKRSSSRWDRPDSIKYNSEDRQ